MISLSFSWASLYTTSIKVIQQKRNTSDRRFGKWEDSCRAWEKNIRFLVWRKLSNQTTDKVIDAVRDVTGYDEGEPCYHTPGLALKLGHSPKKIGDIILCRVIAAENEEMIKAAERFTKLCSNEWTELTSHTALATLSKSKFNKPSAIPFTRDVQLFHQYLKKKSADAVENPTKQESPMSV